MQVTPLRIALTAGLVISVAAPSDAGWLGRRGKAGAVVNTPREEKADKNDDGVVSRKERTQATTKGYLDKRSDVDRKWEEKADKDGDGKVSVAELRTHHREVMDTNGDGSVSGDERKTYWTTRRAKVNTSLEKKYDTDGDGYISGDEAKEMLKDTLRIINTNGRAKVTNELEKEYDADGDGVIDREEAQALRDALGV